MKIEIRFKIDELMKDFSSSYKEKFYDQFTERYRYSVGEVTFDEAARLMNFCYDNDITVQFLPDPSRKINLFFKQKQ